MIIPFNIESEANGYFGPNRLVYVNKNLAKYVQTPAQARSMSPLSIPKLSSSSFDLTITYTARFSNESRSILSSSTGQPNQSDTSPHQTPSNIPSNHNIVTDEDAHATSQGHNERLCLVFRNTPPPCLRVRFCQRTLQGTTSISEVYENYICLDSSDKHYIDFELYYCTNVVSCTTKWSEDVFNSKLDSLPESCSPDDCYHVPITITRQDSSYSNHFGARSDGSAGSCPRLTQSIQTASFYLDRHSHTSPFQPKESILFCQLLPIPRPTTECPTFISVTHDVDAPRDGHSFDMLNREQTSQKNETFASSASALLPPRSLPPPPRHYLLPSPSSTNPNQNQNTVLPPPPPYPLVFLLPPPPPFPVSASRF